MEPAVNGAGEWARKSVSNGGRCKNRNAPATGKNNLPQRSRRLNLTFLSWATVARDFVSHPVSTLTLPPMPIAVGSKAPDFTLKSKTAEGLKDIKLSDNFGQKQTVLLFFPLAYTGVCTQEMCDQTSGLAEYEALGANVIAISVDSPFTQEAWAKTNKIGITLASDLNKTTTKAYDVLFPMLAGVGDTSARAAFVIGKDGVVKYAEQTATPKDLPNFAAVKAALAN
jgi:peroxiredoxin